MALFENFPYTNLHELNLDWLIDMLNKITQNQVLSVNGQTGHVVLYENAVVQFPNVEEDNWEIIRSTDGTRRGILFGNNDKAYIIYANNMAEIYTNGNQPPYPVTRVNGQTGDIILYSDAQVRFPDLDDLQLHNWNVFRSLNGVVRGIQFDETGHAYIIDGNNRYKIYDELDTPPYPVESVNGQTGTVTLFSDSAGNVSFPDYTDAGATGWVIERNINNTPYGIILNTDGTLAFKVGSDIYSIYTENNLPEGFVEDPEADILEIINPVESGTVWGLIRSTDDGNVGIIFDNDSQLTEPECDIGYYDQYDQLQRVKLLTAADIPSASGVVSINGLNGVVVLTGENINYSSSDSTKLDAKIDTIQGALAYYEAGANATQNISEGDFVCWKGAAYVASQAISIGDTLSASNLTALPAGFANKIQDLMAGKLDSQKFSLIANTQKVLTCAATGFRGLLIVDGVSAKSMVLINCPGNGSISKLDIALGSGVTWNMADAYQIKVTAASNATLVAIRFTASPLTE